MKLGVNIDHIATLREARRINEPDPLEALSYVKRAGAHQVTLHLREDRRHIVDHDVRRIIESSILPVNVEAAANMEIIDYICSLKPYSITLVPEKREEVTTEGGLCLSYETDKLQSVIKKIKQADIIPSLFIDPDLSYIKDIQALKVNKVELHTGRYANLFLMLYSNLSKTHHCIEEFDIPKVELEQLLQEEVVHIQAFVKQANSVFISVAAGHGLNVQNLDSIVNIAGIKELNIGHSIIARSIFVGLEQAVREILHKMIR